MAQYVINTGEFPNDGTGDPLRTAFELVNLNFDQIFAAGPVLSNIEIINNTIYTTNTNGNLILNPNGIGNVIANAHVIPDSTKIRNLGAPELMWDTVYSQYFVGDGNGISNVAVSYISNGTTKVSALENSDVTIDVNGVGNIAVFTVAGLDILGQISATGNVSGSNVVTNNIYGNSITLTATGTNQNITLAPNGTGNINVSGRYINNLADPFGPQDAATKAYVDSVAEGLDIKASVALATVAALPAYTYNNGASGVGATITGNAVGALSIDSTLVTANSRVLIKNEIGADQPYNGIYVVTDTGSPGSPYVLTRSTDFNQGAEIPGGFTFVEYGSNADSGWVCTTNSPITVGTTPIVFVQFSGAGSYLAGNGLSLNGTTFNVNVDGTSIVINGSNQVSVKDGATLVNPNIGTATGTSLSLTGNVTSGNVTSGSISSTGNVTGGNLLTTGVVSSTGNVTGGNVLSNGYISATSEVIASGNVTGGNLTTSGSVSATGGILGQSISVSGNVAGGNVNTVGVISASGNVTGGNVITAGLVTAVGNIISTANVEGGNVKSTGIVSSTGNVIGGNITTLGVVTALGNITGSNLVTNGTVYANGDVISNATVQAANISSLGIVSAVGNVTTDSYLVGNGAFITGLSTNAAALVNGTTNLSTTLNGNANVTISGTSNVVVWTTTGEYVKGEVSATGDITGANLYTTGVVSATGDGTFANISTAGSISGNTLSTIGNVNAGNIRTTGLISATGNIVGSNIQTSGSVNASGNVTTGNVRTPGIVSAQGNIITDSNLNANNVSATGNVYATNFIGNISGNIDAAGNITEVQFNDTGDLLGASAGFTFDKTANLLTVSGNIVGGNVTTGGQISAVSTVTSGLGFYGDVYTTLIDSPDSSAIAMIPDVILLSSLDVNQNVNVGYELTAGNISTVGNVTAGIVNTQNIVGGEINFTANVDGINFVTVGNINVGNTWINNLAEPLQAQDAATKFYVDSVAQGLDIKTAVALATATTLPSYTYNNGISGVGATITATANGTLSIDSTTTTGNARVLVKNETNGNAPYNGIYVVTQTGNLTAPYVLTRSADMNATGEFTSAFTFVQYGNTQADTGWVCTTDAPVTVGTTPITFTQFSGAGTYLAGNGIAIVGEFINALTDGITTAINGSNQIEVKAGAQLTTPNIGAATGTSLSVTGNIIGGAVYSDTTISAVGNVTAPTFYGNLVGNITGNIDAGGSNTAIQFNDDNILAGSTAFTFDKTSNLVTITGNVTANTVLVGNIIIPSTGNITVANVNINNLANPIQNQDAATKIYVDNEIANVLPTITNQTISPDGVTATYTLNQSTTAVGILVTINGVTQTPVANYTVVGNQITFGEVPYNTDIIQVRFLSGTTSSPTVQLPTYTVAEANSLIDVVDGQMIYVSNGDAGQPCMAVYSGGTWKKISLGATIST